eukprot:1142040-Pelagomonas_calceolata.AAC.1
MLTVTTGKWGCGASTGVSPLIAYYARVGFDLAEMNWLRELKETVAYCPCNNGSEAQGVHGGLANHHIDEMRLKCTGYPRDPSSNLGLRRAKTGRLPKMAKNVQAPTICGWVDGRHPLYPYT